MPVARPPPHTQAGCFVVPPLPHQHAVIEHDLSLRAGGDQRVMRHHDDGGALLMQLAEQVEHNALVAFVEIAGRFVGQHQFRAVDQRPRDAHTLLLAPGQLGGQMMGTLLQSHPFKRGPSPVPRRPPNDNTGRPSRSPPPSDAAPDGTSGTPGRSRSCARRPAARRSSPPVAGPSNVTEPRLGESRHPMMFISVVLPEPDEPTIASHCPSGTVRFRSSTALSSP